MGYILKVRENKKSNYITVIAFGSGPTRTVKYFTLTYRYYMYLSDI